MNEFKLFNKLLPQTCTVLPFPISTCSHTTMINYTCSECGIEVDKKAIDKEWNYGSDPSRCYIRKSKDNTIHHDITQINISDNIKDLANHIYNEACGEEIHRALFRKAIVFASVFNAYKLVQNPQSCNNLIKLFKIKRKTALRGIKYINKNLPDKSTILTLYINPTHLIYEFMRKFDTSKEQIDNVISLYHSIEGKSDILNRSRPQSSAAGIIYYYTLLQGRPIDIKTFIKKVELSELTVRKIAVECSRLFNTPHILPFKQLE